MFIDYNTSELIIFNKVKQYFEKLPPSIDDYDTAFQDLIAQYGAGGEHYIASNSLYEDLIESTILVEYQELSVNDKKELHQLYESNFLSNYYDEDNDSFMHTEEDLALVISGRFKAWIDDNFSFEDDEEID